MQHFTMRFWFLPLLFLTVSFAADRPNIIVIMPDDMGYGDTGATGNEVIRTPNLDRLASESASLTNFYVSPVCSPTRASLMTGRYNYRTRCIDTFKGRSMMDPSEVTIAEHLSQAGYATGIFGKWHLGDNYPMRPQEQGFDESLIHRGGGLAQPSEPIENEGRYTDPILFHNGVQVQAEGYCTDVFFDAAMDFMEESSEAGKPFFVYLPPNAPHGPYDDVPEELLKYYQSVDLSPILNGNESEKHKDTVARVFAMVENIDRNVGRLDGFLKEKGLREDTLVLFFTDNGPNTARYVGPFRGMKSNVHEGGIHTMFWARWPGQFKAGTESDRIAAHIDVLPTLLDVAGVGASSAGNLDGRSLLPLLRGVYEEWPDRTLFFQSHRGNEPVPFHHFAVRQQNWKLVRPTGFGAEDLSKPKPFELYHLSEDPGESNNLAAENPERVEELKGVYQRWFSDVSSTRPDNYSPPRIVIGNPAEPVTDLSIQDWRVPNGANGWGDGGEWMVNFEGQRTYDVSVRWDDPVGARDVTLKIGEETFSGTLEDGDTEVVFPRVSVGAGETSVSVNLGGEVGRDTVLRFVVFEQGE